MQSPTLFPRGLGLKSRQPTSLPAFPGRRCQRADSAVAYAFPSRIRIKKPPAHAPPPPAFLLYYTD
nr:MAG TPA: hypothetical protein [Caudoviricetes sp.]